MQYINRNLSNGSVRSKIEITSNDGKLNKNNSFFSDLKFTHKT